MCHTNKKFNKWNKAKPDKSVNIKRKNGVLWLYQCLIMEKSVIEKKEHNLILNIKKNKNKFDATLTT